MYEKIENLMKKGAKLLNSKYAIIGGAMTWISDANLVSELSNAGIFGVLASGAMDGNLLKAEIEKTKAKTKNSFGVNIILMNPYLEDLIDACKEEKVSHIILAGGIPSKNLIEKIHSLNMQVFGFAQSLAIAKRLFQIGIDALILEGNEAGGHVGPVSTIVLMQSILLNMKGYPIFVAGGINRGEMIASILKLGAIGCQLGTIFACAKESLVHKNFKQAFFKANARDVTLPTQLDKRFPITPVRSIKNKGTEEFLEKQKDVLKRFYDNEISAEKARLELEHFWAGALKRAVKEGDTERGSIMAGQIVEVVNEERGIKEILTTILDEAENFLNR